MDINRNEHDKIRFAIFGTGWMADTFAKELLLHPETELLGVASPSGERAAEFATKFDIPMAHKSYETLALNDLVDIIYIATTNERHFDNAFLCLDCNKPVLVEKPITLSTESLDRLVNKAREKKLFLMEAMWMRCFPFYRMLETRLAPIGPVRSMRASFRIDIPFNPSHRLYNPALGGGALFDIGIYPVHLLQRLWGIGDASVEADIQWAETGTDVSGRFQFAYDDGRQATLEYGILGHRPHRATFVGERGSITVEDFFHPSKITVEIEGKPTAVEHLTYPVMGYQYEIDEAVTCLRQGKIESDLVPLRVSREITEWMLTTLASEKQRAQ